MTSVFAQLSYCTTGLSAFVLGAVVAQILITYIAWSTDSLTREPHGVCPHCAHSLPRWLRIPVMGSCFARGRCPQCGEFLDRLKPLVPLVTGMLFAVFLIATLQFDCQKTDEVRPDTVWKYGRIVYHLVLISLLVVATATDLKEYVIPDSVVLPGILFGLGLATISGDLQIIHLWVDWNHPQVDLVGPYIPKWIQEYRHWHGLAWSLTGLVVGGGVIWLIRVTSRFVLGVEALGFGDVTLMAMIGAYLGWQPVLFVFLLAPFCAVFVGLAVKLLTNRPYVSYGPYLSVATFIVLIGWKWLWLLGPTPAISIRRLFGDPPTLAILAAIAFGSLGLLLGLLRLYRMIPGKDRES